MPNLQDPRSSSSYQYSASSYAATPIVSMPPLALIPGVAHPPGVSRPSGRSPSPPPPPHPGPVGVDGPSARGPTAVGAGGSAVGPIGRSSSPPSPTGGGGRISGISQHHQHHHHHHSQQPQPPQQQLLPPTCGARQLSKLKRFLTTLQQFAIDISLETGDHVRSLVLALVNSQLSVEEFHAKLQQATNFPLRPFVIPFLKANLPLLQREMLHCAQLARQSPQQYVATYNDRVLLDAAVGAAATTAGGLPPPPAVVAPMTSPHTSDPSHDSPLSRSPIAAVVGEKRKSPPTGQMSKISPPDVAIKRPRTANSTRSTSCSPPPSRRIMERRRPDNDQPVKDDVNRTPPLLLIQNRDVHLRNADQRRHDNERVTPDSHSYDRGDDSYTDQIAEDLKHVENLLQGIIGMVDQCKMAIGGLREQWKVLSLPPRMDGTLSGVNQRAVTDVVNEVKCKAIVEIQKVIAESEAKTERLVAAERARLEVAVASARQQAIEEILQSMKNQHDSAETCWNCGRKATETCSGCNIACYCGSFCQHRDWVSHQLVCRRSSVPRGPSPTTNSRSPPTPRPQDGAGGNKRLVEIEGEDDVKIAKAEGGSPRGGAEHNSGDDDVEEDDVLDLVKCEHPN